MLALILVGLILVLGVLAYVYSSSSKSSSSSDDKKSSTESDGKTAQGSLGPVPIDDFVQLFNQLTPESTHLDVLWSILTMNDVLEKATAEVDKITEMREKKAKQLEEEKAKKERNDVDFDDLVNDDGWGDDGDDAEGDDAVKKAKEEEERKQADLASLRKATGKMLPKMEGLDEGVLGQGWVEKTMKEAGAWPPELGAVGNRTFEYKPKNGKVQKLKPLDHPAFRRCLCMTMGRLHSNLLNTHEELIKAGMNKAVDETYFKGSMEFRQRIALILDATLRLALTMQNYPLFCTLVETLAAFKIGCDPTDSKSLPWFNGTMARQYNTLPRLEIGGLIFEEAPPLPKQGETQPPKPQEQPTPLTELVAGKSAVIVLPVDRKHAEAFTKVKLAQCEKQRIPPQIALQGYREAWWFLVRWEPVSSDVENVVEEIPRKFLDNLDAPAIKRFEDTAADLRVRTAFPMMVQNIAQKSGAVKVRIMAPTIPGVYKFKVAVKSSDFLGADEEEEIEIKVVEAPEGDDSDGEEEEEPKKDK